MLREADCVALITAAGASTRMGRPKQLLPWGTDGAARPLVAHQAHQLRRFRDVVAVLGAHEAVIRAAAPMSSPARYVSNPAWTQGRSTTVAAGAHALPNDAAAVMVVAVDQPLEATIIAQLLTAFDPEVDRVAVPAFGGRRGHPLLLRGDALPLLKRAADFEQGLRSIVRALGPPRTVAVDRPVHDDLNTPAAYAHALGVRYTHFSLSRCAESEK